VDVTVLTGGASAERDVSLATGVQVARALREAGHRVRTVDTATGLLERQEEERLLEHGVDVEAGGGRRGIEGGIPPGLVEWPEVREADVLFLALHGGAGEDGTVQALLDLAGVPYAGSGHLGCALSMDKDVSKRLLRDAGIPTPPWEMLPAGGLSSPGEVGNLVDRLGLPLVVKPASGGSTLGLTVVRTPGELEPAAAAARAYDREVMAEGFVAGREITVGVVAEEALPVGEIVPDHEIFDYECKYRPGKAEEIFPAEIPGAAARQARELSLRVHRLLRMSGFSRVDFILDGDGEPWCLEANALPGMTATSLLPQAAAAAGVSFPELCDRIVREAVGEADGGGD